MKNFNKRDYIYLSILYGFVIFFIAFLFFKGHIFGSVTDWANQHSVIPEYFRTHFYNTGKLIPSFAPNLGLGQNIFYLSYYGLLSPIVLISYLLPFIPMYMYIELASILCLLISVTMLYSWLKKKYDPKIAFLSSILLLLNTTFFYQFHRHIMFVIYMPFLIGCLKSVDLYLKEKRPIPLIIYVFLMIMTSYYFSVSGLITVGIYSIYKIIEEKSKKFNYSNLFKIIFYCSIGILLAGVLLIPTLYAISSGRIETLKPTITFINLINPFNNYTKTFYNSYYTWGISLIYIISIINAFLSKKKSTKFLSIVTALFITFPICSYTLNGFMYIDGKCFLPYLPVALLINADFFQNLFKNKLDYNKLLKIFLPISIVIFLMSIKKGNSTIFITDFILLLTTILLIRKNNKPNLIFIPVILISLLTLTLSSLNDKYLYIDEVKNINNKSYYNLSKIKDETNLYRTQIIDNKEKISNKVYNYSTYQSSIYSSLSNKDYNYMIKNIFQLEEQNRELFTITSSSNLLFNVYTGSKYLITSQGAPLGYELIKKENDIGLYENKDVLPIGYASNKIMSLREFETLKYPETIDALLNYIIVDKSADNVYSSNVNKYNGEYKITKHKNITYNIQKNTLLPNISSFNENISNNLLEPTNNNSYLISSKENGELTLKLDKKISNEVLIIKFNMNEPKLGYACSTDISINGVNNSLSCSNWKYFNGNRTFEYVLSNNNSFDTLNIKFTEGVYNISNIELYTIEYNDIKNYKNNKDELIIDQIESTDNKLIGTIEVKNDGYVKLTIPYEKKGFKIYVDGERVSKVKVDKTFLGFEITKGKHNIEVVYKTPYLKTGIIVTIIGVVFLSLVITYKYFEKKYINFSKKLKQYLTKLYKETITYLKNNKGYILLFLSLFILDLFLRLSHNSSINYYKWYKIIPNLLSIIWILLILFLTKLFKNKIGKTIYLICYIFNLIMFLVHSIYYSYFNQFFDWSVMQVAGEGTAYFSSVFSNIKPLEIIIIIISIFLTISGIKNIKHSTKFNIKKFILIISIFICGKFLLPLGLGNNNSEVEWDDWRNARRIYNNYNDNNKSLMVSGLFEYNIRNFYINFIKDNNTLNEKEEKILEENFKNNKEAETNNYTGIFKGKNLIIVQLESIDNFLVKKNIMPTIYKISNNSLNFENHYSFTSGGGSTFNSEFMVNTGYSSAYNYNQSAYTFSRNSYPYSLPNLFKKEGYTVNAFHMNTAEYYSRKVNYEAFGYDNYYGLKDQDIYNDNEYWLDTELINNKTFNSKMFNKNKPFVSYIITYTAHMPYTTEKGNCQKLTNKTGLTEYECLKIQAKETDDMFKLLLENLQEKDLLDNTVIVAFADHYIYTLEDKTILEKYKETSNNLINHTPFFIYDGGNTSKNIKGANSQLDILPTILNLFGINYNENNYIGRDILNPKYDPLVFFPDGSWYDGSTYVENGEYSSGKRIKQNKIEEYNKLVKRKMILNDAVIKSDYFKEK